MKCIRLRGIIDLVLGKHISQGNIRGSKMNPTGDHLKCCFKSHSITGNWSTRNDQKHIFSVFCKVIELINLKIYMGY